MKIALAKMPGTYADWYNRPVLGLSYLASFLTHHGLQCRIFDAYFTRQSLADLVEDIAAWEPDLVGVTAMTHEVAQAAQAVAEIKRRHGCQAVIGGPHATALPQRTLEEFPTFDYSVCGEGEKPLLALARHLDGNVPGDAAAIPRVAHHEPDGHVHLCPPEEPLSPDELDALPLPAFEQYFGDEPGALSGPRDEYPLMSSRGCPFRCAFCMRVLGQKVRRRSNERILAEIEHAIARYSAHTINFIDEIFLFDAESTRRLLHSLIDSGLSRRIRWSGLTRANFVTRDLIALAKEAGCFRLEMGVESGNDRILKNTRKGITVAQAEQAVQIIQEAGIQLATYYILGHPGETEETVRDTMRLAARLNTTSIAVGTMVPYPGTAVYDMAKRGEMGYRLVSEDWSRYDKYGGGALEIEGLPQSLLAKYQRKTYLRFYVRNIRLWGLLRFLASRRHALWYFLRRRRCCVGRIDRTCHRR